MDLLILLAHACMGGLDNRVTQCANNMGQPLFV